MIDFRNPYVQTSQLAAINCEFLVIYLSIFHFLYLSIFIFSTFSISKICISRKKVVPLQQICIAGYTKHI